MYYLQVHPDARSYRIKTIPYYSDLCEIYKNVIIEGKSNLSSPSVNIDNKVADSLLEGVGSPPTAIDDKEKTMVVFAQPSSVGEADVDALHEILIDEDYGVSVSEGVVSDTPQPVADRGSTVVTRTRTYWQPPMDRYFIDLMLDHVHKGNQIDGLFHRQAWMEMIASFNARFGFKYDIDILKNRYKTLRRQYNVIKNLLELDGFVWDDARQMVTADDNVWQDYIKVCILLNWVVLNDTFRATMLHIFTSPSHLLCLFSSVYLSIFIFWSCVLCMLNQTVHNMPATNILTTVERGRVTGFLLFSKE